jgi:hypothetical protein
MTISLANPEGLWGAVLAAPIVFWYLRPARWPRQPVAAAWLWQQALALEPARAAWQRYRDAVSLAVALLVLALLVLALADPQIGRPLTAVVVIDTSMPPAATHDDGRLLPRKTLAEWEALELGDHDRITLISAGAEVRVRCGPTGDRQALERAMASIEPTTGTPRLAEAVALAHRVLETQSGGTILVLGDAGRDKRAAWAQAEDVRLARSIEARLCRDNPRRPPLWLWLVAAAGLLLAAEWPLNQWRWTS